MLKEKFCLRDKRKKLVHNLCETASNSNHINNLNTQKMMKMVSQGGNMKQALMQPKGRHR